MEPGLIIFFMLIVLVSLGMAGGLIWWAKQPPKSVLHAPSASRPPVSSPSTSFTPAGIIGMVASSVVFGLGVLAGFSLVPVILGLALLGAGFSSRHTPPLKLCPACRMAVPLQATV
jgi:hypothetical protein